MKTLITRLILLAEECDQSNPEMAQKIRSIYGMISQKALAEIEIRSRLEEAIKDYYQIQLDTVGFDTSHWKATLKELLKQIITINESTGKTRKAFYFDNEGLGLLVKSSNEEVKGPFDQAARHLGLDPNEDVVDVKFDSELSFKDLCKACDLEMPVYRNYYSK